jgi:putative ABC transport system permease protein
VQSLPGVQAAGVALALPLSGRRWLTGFAVEGRPATAAPATGLVRAASAGYFEALRIPLRRGRWLSPRDNREAPRVVVINEAFARGYFPGRDPLGRHISTAAFSARRAEIVGIAGDVRQSLTEETEPEAWYSYAQVPLPWLTLVVRTESDPAALAGPLRRAVAGVDPLQPIARLAPMNNLIAATTAQPRFRALLLGGFAAVSLFLAVLGIYGVAAEIASRRSRELGIRIALGASPRSAIGLLLRDGLRLALAGVAAGLLGALWLSRLLSGMLFEVSPADPVTVWIPAALMLFATLVASYVPARRTASADPMIALRDC